MKLTKAQQAALDTAISQGHVEVEVTRFERSTRGTGDLKVAQRMVGKGLLDQTEVKTHTTNSGMQVTKYRFEPADTLEVGGGLIDDLLG